MAQIFFWWDDAVAVANGYAATNGRRYRVMAVDSGLWAVSEAGAA